MAKIICSPTISSGCRRKLPVGRSAVAIGATGEVHHHAMPLEGRDAQVSAQDDLDPRKLLSERDKAMERAAAAEAQLSRFRKQLEDHKSEAWEVGFQEGLLKGAEKAAAEKKAATESLLDLVSMLSKERESLIQIAEDSAVEIGFAAAAKIIGQANVEQGLLAAMVKAAMNKVNERDGLVVCLSAADCQRMEMLKAECANGDQWSKIEFVSDEKVGLGGCIIRSRAGSLEARLEYQMNMLKKCLIAAREQKSEEG